MANEPLEAADTLAPMPSVLGGLFQNADRFYQQQQYENVVELLSGLLAQGFKHPSIWLRLGNALHRLQRLDEAQGFYRMAAQHPLPDASQLGYLEAARINGKAWLNLAALNLTFAKQALAGFRATGIPNSEQNRVLQEQAEVADTLRRSQVDLSSSRPVLISPSSSKGREVSERESKERQVKERQVKERDNTDPEVTIEYLDGAPQTILKSRPQ